MNPVWIAVWLGVGLFVGILICIEIGRWAGRRQALGASGEPMGGISIVDAAIFGLLGLLIGFTFSGAATRLETRRQLVAQEANAIGTAYLRLDLLPPDHQPNLRRLFREYLDARLAMYENVWDMTTANAKRAEVIRLQGEIWSATETGARAVSPTPTAILLLPAINEMIDITTTRTLAARSHVPAVIIVWLFALSLLSAVLVGYALSPSKTRSRLHVILYAAVVAVSIYVILDLEYPRIGLIRLDAAAQVLHQLRDTLR